MGKNELKGRDNWQTLSGPAGMSGAAEVDFFSVFTNQFMFSNFEVIDKPRDFANIYKSVVLQEELDKTIYHPEGGYGTHGIIPDYAIRNTESGKTLYVEVKRQDGWVEGKPQSAGRGNAHERGCKYFTPGLMSLLRERSKINSDEIYPFWLVYIGDITRDPKRVREITMWFNGRFANYFFWQDTTNPTPLIEHFNSYLKPYLL